MIAISVVIAAFNAAPTVEETLASVGAQSLPPFEIILVDDGSTDGTAERALQARPDIVVLKQANAGAAAATNAGVRRACGDALAMLDADDLWPTDRLAILAEGLAKPFLDGVGGHVQAFPCPSLNVADAARLHVAKAPMPSLLPSAMLLRRSAFDRVGLYDETLRVGYSIDWVHRAQRLGLRFAILDEIVLRRRIRAGSLSAPSPSRDRDYLEVARRAVLRHRMKGTQL